MHFVVKDLMISVLPQEGPERWGQLGNWPSLCACGCTHCSGCSLCSGCTYCSGGCTVNSGDLDAGAEVINPADLRAIRQRMEQALAAYEAQNDAVERRLRPQTRQEAEQLEQQLRGALEEVRRLKEGLQ